MYPSQRIATGAAAIGHDTVVRAYDTRKKTKAQYPLPVVMLQAFIVDQGDPFFEDGAEHRLVIGLFFFGMGEEKIGFIR